MALQPFSVPFLGELECDILERLGQRDLLSTSLVCRRFRAISGPLLLRHIARRQVLVNEQGERKYPLLPNTYKVVARLVQDGDLCRHVRYFDMPTDVGPSLKTVQPDALRAMWLSMTNLVALSLKAKLISSVSDWGLKGVYFPKLRRMRMDSKSLCPSLITLHVHSLTHLRFDDNVVLPPGCLQATSLTNYNGPLEAVLRFGAHATALQVCAIFERELYRRTEWPSLSPLAAHRSLQTLMVVTEVSEIELLQMLEDCLFASIDALLLLYNNARSNPQNRRVPDFERLLAPFPTAKRIAVFDNYWDFGDDEDGWREEQGPAWAQRLSKTCPDAVFVAFQEDRSLIREQGEIWSPSCDIWDFIESFGQWVVPAVQG